MNLNAIDFLNFYTFFYIILNTLQTLSVVFFATSLIVIFFILLRHSAINFIFLGSFTLPLIGDKKGLSVSRTIFSNGISLITSFKLLFLNVNTPPIPNLYPNFIYSFATYLLSLKQCITPKDL